MDNTAPADPKPADEPCGLVVCGKPITVRRHGPLRVAVLRDELCDDGVEDPEAMALELTRTGAADVLNFRQQLPHTERMYAYPMEWDNLAVLGITTYDEWWNKLIRNDARRMVRKAEKSGIVVRPVPFSDELVWGIKSIWDETPFRQGRFYYHYRKDFDTVKRENSTFLERAQFIGAYLGDELVGFNKVFYTDQRADHIEIISKVAHRDKSPTNALLAKSVELAARRGARYMTYAKFSYGKKGDDSLTDFKRRNGFERIEIPRYYVPLTAAGRLAVRLGLQNGLKEALPPFALRAISRVRTRWGKLTTQFIRGRAGTGH